MKKVKNRVNKVSKITVATAVVASSFPVIVPAVSAASFSDVSASNVHAEDIITLHELGVLKGYPDGTFKPTANVTRGQAAMIISRMLKLDVEDIKDPNFKDINKYSEAYPHIAALAAAGIINGYNGQFMPENFITRGEMAKIIARAYNIEGDFKHVFEDVPVNHEFTPYINALAATGITKGKATATYEMNSYVLREQIASFIVRADAYKKQNESKVISGKLEEITASSITLSGIKYSLPQGLDFLTNDTNKAALQDAVITFVSKGRELKTIKSISIVNGSSFNGNDYEFEKITLYDGITAFSNVKVDELHHNLSSNLNTYTNVVAKKVTADAPITSVASLKTVAIAQQTAKLKLIASMIDDLKMNAKASEIEADSKSYIDNLDLSQSTSVYLEGDVGTLIAAVGAYIRGEGSIERIIAASKNVTVNPSFNINEVEVNGEILSWLEAIASNSIQQSNSPTTNTENNNPPIINPEVNNGGSTSDGETGGDNTGDEDSGNPPLPNDNEEVEKPDTSEVDKVTVSENITQIKALLAKIVVTNEATEQTILTALSEIKDVTVSLSTFEIKVATEEEAGYVRAKISVKKNDVAETIEFKQSISILEKESSNDEQFVIDKVAEINNLLSEMVISNSTTQAAIEAEITKVEDVKVKVDSFSLKESTAIETGKLVVKISVSFGNVSKLVVFEKDIAINQEAADKLAVEESIKNLKLILASVEPDNSFTELKLKEIVGLFESVEIKDFQLVEAAEEMEGRVTATIVITVGTATNSLLLDKIIAPLPVDQTKVDLAIVETKARTINEILAAIEISNTTTQEDIRGALNSITEVENRIEGYNLMQSTATTVGQLSVTIVVTKGEASKEVIFTKEIGIDEEALVTETVKEINESVESLSVSNLTTKESIQSYLPTIDGVQIKVSEFSIVPSTGEAIGHVKAKITVKVGVISETIEIIKEIAIDEVAANELEVYNAKLKVEEIINKLNVTNDFTKEQFERALSTIEVATVEDFVLEQSTSTSPGKVVANIVLSKGEAKLIVPFEKHIGVDYETLVKEKVAEIKTLLNNLDVSNSTTKADIELAIINVPNVLINISEFSIVKSTSTTTGQVTASIIVRANDANETITFVKEITVDQVAADEEKAAELKVAVEQAIDNITVTNEYTEANLQAALQAISNVTISNFNVQKSTSKASGEVTATITIQVGAAIETVEFKKEIAINHVEADKEAVDNTVNGIKELLKIITISNTFTEADLTEALSTFEGVRIENFLLNEATVLASGNVSARIVVTKGSESKSIQFNQVISQLQISDETVVNNKKASIEQLLTGFHASNATTIESIKAIIGSELDDKVSIKDFMITKSTVEASGKVSATIVIQKGEAKAIITFEKTVAKLVQQYTETVPVLSEDNTIVINDEVRQVSEETAAALQLLQTLAQSSADNFIQMELVENDDAVVTLAAVTIQPATSNQSLDLVDIPEMTQVTIVANGSTTIENLSNNQEVIIEGANSEVTFTGTTEVNNIILRDVNHVNGLNAKNVVVSSDLETTFDNVQIDVLTIDESKPLSVASLSPMMLFATTSTFKVNIAQEADIKDIVINRSDTIVDIHKNVTVSNLKVNTKNITIIANSIVNVTVLNGVTNLIFGNEENKVSIAKLEVDLSHDLVLTGFGEIKKLAVNVIDATKKIILDSNLKVLENNAPSVIDNGSTHQLISGTKFGYYKFSDSTNVKYIVQHRSAGVTPPQTISSGTTYNSTSGVKLDAMTEMIAIYDTDKRLIGKVITPPSSRQKLFVSTVDQDADLLIFETTFSSLQDLNNDLDHLIIFKQTSSAAGFILTKLFEEVGSHPIGTYNLEIMPYNANKLSIPLANVSQLSQLVIIAEDYTKDYISTANKEARINVLKELAEIAKTTGNTNVIYNYLTAVFALEEETYDSIFTPSIIDALLADQFTSITELVAFTDDKSSDVTYNKIVPTADLLLSNGIAKVSGDGTHSKITIEGTNLLIESVSNGTEYVKFQDNTGAVSILEVVVNNTAANVEDKINTRLVKLEVNAASEILYGTARLVVDGGKTYIIPSELNSRLISYIAGNISSTVGTFNVITTNDAGVMTAVNITPLTINKADLNLTGTISNNKKMSTGFIATDNALHFYPTTSSSNADQYVISSGNKSTAIAITNTNDVLTYKIASKTASATDLGLTQIKSIEPMTGNTTMHTAITTNSVSIFASLLSDEAMFKVTAQDGKVSLLNAKTSTSDIIHLDNVTVVKNVQTLTAGVTMFAPRKMDGTLKEDVIRIVGNTVYATGVGEERIVLSNGTQLAVNITNDSGLYEMEVKPVTAAVVSYTELDLQNISSVVVNGSSAAAVNIANELVSITALANTNGKSEVVITDVNGKKAIIYVNVNAGNLVDVDTNLAGNQLYKVARKELSATDLGMTTISSVSQQTEIARGVNSTAAVKIYATGTGSTTFTVIGNDSKKAIINVLVERDVTSNELVVKEEIVKKNVDFTEVGLLASAAFDEFANGKGIVRIEGNVLYALGAGTVDLAIEGSDEQYYRVTVTKDDASGLYKFADAKLVVKSVYTSTQLGLSVIESATSSNENIATVEYTTDKITLTTQATDGTGFITVNGSEGQSYVYMKKAGQVFTTEIEDATEVLDVTTTGLANIKEGELVGASQVRPVIKGSTVNFFVLTGGKAYYRVIDDTNLVTLINLDTNVNATKGHREIISTYVREEIILTDSNDNLIAPNGEIVSGNSIRLHVEDGKQYAYAITTTGTTVVKLADNSLMQFTPEIIDGIVSIKSEKITNGLVVNDTDLDLNGNLTITQAADDTIATTIVRGKQIIVNGLMDEGETSFVVTDGVRKIRAKVVITNGVVIVEPIKYTVAAGKAIKIHGNKTNAWITEDGKTIYVVDAGTFEFIEDDAVMKVVKKLTLQAEVTKYTLKPVEVIPSVIYNATQLGLTNALVVQPGFNDEVLYAGMVGTDFVAYQKGTGNVDVVVKDGKNQSTLVHFVSNNTTPTSFTTSIANKETPFNKTQYDLVDTNNITIANRLIAEMHEDGLLYLLTQGTTYATITDSNGHKGLATITVSKVGNELSASITPIHKTAAQLAVGATIVSALPGSLTDSTIVRVANNKVYAVGKGTTQVKLDGHIVNVTVNEEASTYTITAGTLINFIELDLGEGTYTVADVSGTNSAKIIKDDNNTPQNNADDKLLIYVTANNGLLDLTITDDSGVKVVHHIKVENGVITNPPVQAIDDLTTEISGLSLSNSLNDVVQMNGNKLHLLRSGNAAFESANGLVNVTVTRNEVTKYLQASQVVVEKELKEKPTTDSAYLVVEKDGKNLLRPTAPSAMKVYYSANYRVASTTTLANDVYTLHVEERHMKKVAYENYGLTNEEDNPIALHSENEDIAKAELNAAGELIVYAGAGITNPSGTTTVTATDKSGKKISIIVTRNENGQISYEVAGQVDAIKFGELGIDPLNGTITVTDYKAEYVQATVTENGISMAAQTAGDGKTSMLIKQNDIVVAIVNVNVTGNKVVPEVVTYNATGFGDVITGNASLMRLKHTPATGTPIETKAFITATGTVLYENGDKAVQIRVVKNSDTGLYSVTPTEFDLIVGATNLDLAIESTVKLNIANSSIAEAHIANNKLFIVAKSLGSTDIMVTKGDQKAVVHAHVKADGITSNVYVKTPGEEGTYVGNEYIQVRNGQLYALATGKSVITLDGTLVNANVTRDINTNEFTMDLERVKHAFTSVVTKVDADNEKVIISSDGLTIYAKEVGNVQLYVNGKIQDVEVVRNSDGTFKIDVKDLQEQVVLTDEQLGLSLTDTSSVTVRAITGSNVLRTQILENNLVVYALGTGSAELVVDDNTVVFVRITAANNKFVIAEPIIAKTKLITGGSVTEIENVENIRLNHIPQKDDGTVITPAYYEIYAFDEGSSIVLDNTGGQKSLYKVVARRDNNALHVITPSLISKELVAGADLTAITDNGVVRGTNDGKLIATGIGTKEFEFDNTIYRVTVTTTGEMNVEILASDMIDLTNILGSITDASTPTHVKFGQISGTSTQLPVTAQSIGTEIVQITDGTNTVLVKIVVTEDSVDSSKKNMSYEIIKHVITTTDLGFLPKTVQSVSNGLIKIDGSNVIVYPGINQGKQYFKIEGEADTGTQAIYSLTIDANGIKLENGIVLGYKVEPLNTSISISDLGVNPVVVAVDGTAKAVVNTATQKLDIILNDTNKSYIIIKGEGDVYKSIEVQASSADYTVTTEIQPTVKLAAITKEALNGPIRSVNDGSKSILYATAAGAIAYENNGKLYNSEVLSVLGKYNFNAASEINVSISDATIIDGQLNIIKNANNSYSASTTGLADYRTATGYKQVEVTVLDNQYVVDVKELFSATLSNSILSITLVEHPTSVKLDGKTVYGGTVNDIGETIVVKTVTGEGAQARVTMYTAKIEANGVADVKYVFAPVKRDILVDTGWDSSTVITSIMISDPTVAREENGILYFLRNEDVTVTVTSETGLQQVIRYSISDDFEITMQNENVVKYNKEVMSDTKIRFTFDLNVVVTPEVAAELENAYFIIAGGTEISSTANIIEATITPLKDYASEFYIYFPEYKEENKAVYKRFNLLIPVGDLSQITIVPAEQVDSSNSTVTVKFIQ